MQDGCAETQTESVLEPPVELRSRLRGVFLSPRGPVWANSSHFCVHRTHENVGALPFGTEVLSSLCSDISLD